MTKILAIDDSIVILARIKKILEKGNYEVITADSGPNGLKQLGEHPDTKLLIVDFNMPGMDGLTMISKMKETQLLKDQIIFMCTTESSEHMQKLGRELGVKAWIVKPIPFNLPA